MKKMKIRQASLGILRDKEVGSSYHKPCRSRNVRQVETERGRGGGGGGEEKREIEARERAREEESKKERVRLTKTGASE